MLQNTKNRLKFCLAELKGGVGTWHMRAYAPSIAQGEGRSLGDGE